VISKYSDGAQTHTTQFSFCGQMGSFSAESFGHHIDQLSTSPLKPKPCLSGPPVTQAIGAERFSWTGQLRARSTCCPLPYQLGPCEKSSGSRSSQ
jgi:hypothetical protein